MSEYDKQELDQLLPFYVNGTLEGSDKEAVETRLKEDATFDQERMILEALRTKVKDQDMGESPGELGLARLKAEIKANKADTPPSTVAANDNSVQSWWRSVAIAACVALAVLGGGQIQTAYLDEGLTTASGGAHSGPVLQIFFEETTTEKTIRSLLQQNQLNIIEGPTAMGFYRVEVLSKQNLASVMRKLETNKAVSEVLEE
ncbi:MAG: hypothetical protein MI743_03070 [Sneathiellales bacterium]|nr:hypothetical protein [Sneathiellales bacterium]